MRTNIYNFLTRPFTIIAVIILTGALQAVDGNLSYFFGIFIALLALWGSKFSWSDFGLGKPYAWRSVSRALLYSVVIFILVDICIQPFVEIYLGEIDLSSLDGLRGSFVNYLIFIVIMWIFAAFGEEFLYRGFFMKQLAGILGNTDRAWWISALAISVLFGIGHYYQGPSGMLTTGLIGLFFGIIFLRNKDNLKLAILTHGFYDMIGITLIYFDQERFILDWFKEII